MLVSDLIAAFEAAGEIPRTTLSTLKATHSVDPTAMSRAAVELVLAEYSRDIGYVRTLDGTWSGTDVTLAGWSAGPVVVSALSGRIESPRGARPRTYVEPEAVDLDSTLGAVYISGIAVGATYRIRYTAVHTFTAATEGGDEPTTELTASDLAPLFKLAASRMLSRIAIFHGETTLRAIAADSVNNQTKSGEYTRLAAAAYKDYRTMLGISEVPGLAPASGFGNMDLAHERIFQEDGHWPL